MCVYAVALWCRNSIWFLSMRSVRVLFIGLWLLLSCSVSSRLCPFLVVFSISLSIWFSSSWLHFCSHLLALRALYIIHFCTVFCFVVLCCALLCCVVLCCVCLCFTVLRRFYEWNTDFGTSKAQNARKCPTMSTTTSSTLL